MEIPMEKGPKELIFHQLEIQINQSKQTKTKQAIIPKVKIKAQIVTL